MTPWLLTAAGWLRRAAGALLKLVATYPWPTACFALLCACGWLWHGWNVADAHLADCKAGRALDRQHYEQAQKDAKAKAEKAKANAESHYRDLAERADHDISQAQTQARADARRYIDAHRVQPSVAGSSGGPAAAPTSGGPGVPASVSPDSVILAEPDVQACADDAAYALKAHEWALSLSQ